MGNGVGGDGAAEGKKEKKEKKDKKDSDASPAGGRGFQAEAEGVTAMAIAQAVMPARSASPSPPVSRMATGVGGGVESYGMVGTMTGDWGDGQVVHQDTEGG